MTASESPYQPPAAGPPPVPDTSGIEPPAVKVFGIIHLVMAGYGILMGGFGLVVQVFGNPFISSKNPAYEAQMQFQEELIWVSVMSGVFALLLAGLLIVSGLKLVRSNPDGVRWSNSYSWTSIATKLVSLIVGVIFVLPMTNRMMDRMVETKTHPGGATSTIIRFSTSLGTVGGPVVMCLYPGLALFFLSRPRVKAWRARNPPSGA